MRAKDVKVLSVGSLAFSSDSRIGVLQVGRPRLSAEDWNLVIQNASKADEGMYECQVNTRQKINYKVFLTVLSLPGNLSILTTHIIILILIDQIRQTQLRRIPLTMK